ncbi:GspH/FimT family pseudopilin [uncultured Alcanivorax sp.]|uniref:GspH/FimT family pseudopilin n=1 Tax=Alcanivorax sp. IL2 TaxID=3396310 RepID=UPI00261E5C13|nr:GspH/FimT family pseudopilin [uncultured Alcanivorax sp.]
MHGKYQHGVTLLEALIALVLMALLVSGAVSSVSSLLARHRLITFQHDIYHALILARHHAVSHGRWVVICPVSDQGGCALPKGDWNRGWRVFETTGSYDCKIESTGLCSHGGRVLLEHGPVHGEFRVEVNSHLARRARFNAMGFSHGYNGRITVCSRQSGSSLGLVVAQSGRVRKARADEVLPCNSGH